MMTRVAVLFVVGVCCVLAEESEFAATTELPKRDSNSEDRLLTNIIHVTNSSQLTQDKSNEEESKKTDKKPRTVIHRDSGHDSRDNSSCCGSRYSSTGSARPDYNYNKIPLGTGRYPEYGERHPVDRWGWQTQSRPPGSTGSSSRPGGAGGGGGGSANGGYSGNGVYAGSQSGDRYGPRPVYGSESSNRPSTLGYGSGNGGYGYGGNGYGGYGRPTGYGSYGVSGTLADGDEFGSGDLEGSMPQPPGNLHTQKAVALKALAGVALIGAAAALASNPVLLPIGIVTGRKKRSETFSEETLTDFQMDYILNTLKRNLAEIQRGSSTNRLVVSPRCVARLTCEIQKDYLTEIDKDTEFLDTDRKYYLIKLLQKNVLNISSVSANVKNLIKFAAGVASENKNCDVFTCNYVRKG
ncbi:uncharacterized protein [Linepithema humile]|uniref:uncharacterized protein n=1 Tax=Linepithema humile TaxID=83485 RepID=UPI00351EEB64